MKMSSTKEGANPQKNKLILNNINPKLIPQDLPLYTEINNDTDNNNPYCMTYSNNKASSNIRPKSKYQASKPSYLITTISPILRDMDKMMQTKKKDNQLPLHEMTNQNDMRKIIPYKEISKPTAITNNNVNINNNDNNNNNAKNSCLIHNSTKIVSNYSIVPNQNIASITVNKSRSWARKYIPPKKKNKKTIDNTKEKKLSLSLSHINSRSLSKNSIHNYPGNPEERMSNSFRKNRNKNTSNKCMVNSNSFTHQHKLNNIMNSLEEKAHKRNILEKYFTKNVFSHSTKKAKDKVSNTNNCINYNATNSINKNSCLNNTKNVSSTYTKVNLNNNINSDLNSNLNINLNRNFNNNLNTSPVVSKKNIEKSELLKINKYNQIANQQHIFSQKINLENEILVSESNEKVLENSPTGEVIQTEPITFVNEIKKDINDNKKINNKDSHNNKDNSGNKNRNNNKDNVNNDINNKDISNNDISANKDTTNNDISANKDINNIENNNKEINYSTKLMPLTDNKEIGYKSKYGISYIEQCHLNNTLLQKKLNSIPNNYSKDISENKISSIKDNFLSGSPIQKSKSNMKKNNSKESPKKCSSPVYNANSKNKNNFINRKRSDDIIPNRNNKNTQLKKSDDIPFTSVINRKISEDLSAVNKYNMNKTNSNFNHIALPGDKNVRRNSKNLQNKNTNPQINKPNSNSFLNKNLVIPSNNSKNIISNKTSNNPVILTMSNNTNSNNNTLKKNMTKKSKPSMNNNENNNINQRIRNNVLSPTAKKKINIVKPYKSFNALNTNEVNSNINIQNSFNNNNNNIDAIMNLKNNSKNTFISQSNNNNTFIKIHGKNNSTMNLSSKGIPHNKNNSNKSNLADNNDNNTQREEINTILKVSKIDSSTIAGYSSKTQQKINQDNFFIEKNILGIDEAFFVGVCDGHGVYGHLCSEYISANLPDYFNTTFSNFISENSTSNSRTSSKNSFIITKSSLENIQKKKNSKTLNEIITKTFTEFDKVLEKENQIDTNFSGTTCSSLLIFSNKIVSINLGDSRAILGRYKNGSYQTVSLTRDHKPTEQDEFERIVENKGRISPYFEEETKEFIGPKRIWLKDSDIPGLAMTRSFGDTIAHSVGVISIPEIREFNFDGSEKFCIIASDGVWEFIDSEESVYIVKEFYENNLDSYGAVNALANEAFKRWKREEDIVDDITAVVIFFE